MWAYNKKQFGFTIVELLIVVVVIAILATITAVAYSGITDRAKYSDEQSDISSLNKAVLMYYADNGKYPSPTNVSGCTNGWCGWDQATGDNFIPGLSPKYVSATPQMPASNANGDTYLYRSVDGTSYQLMRYRDNTLGGLPTIERNSPISAATAFNTSGWGYKSDNVAWGS